MVFKQEDLGMCRLHAVLAGSLAMLLVSCASTPKPPNKFGHYHDYPYKTPEHVRSADDDECGRRANSGAFASIRGMSDTPALMFGAIGAVVQISRAQSKMNSTYEEKMKSCLREKGYEIAD